MRIEAHAVWLQAFEACVVAETDAGLNAAASLFDTEPWRARPSSGRAELDRARSTTSKLAISAKATAGPHCTSYLVRRHAPLPNGQQAQARAAAQGLGRHHPVPGIGSPAGLRAITRCDLALMRSLL